MIYNLEEEVQNFLIMYKFNCKINSNFTSLALKEGKN